MVEVECYSGYKVNERPIAFTLLESDCRRSFQVREILDTWLGESSDYFKVEADDANIYVLKYDRKQDQWDLVFYQDTRKPITLQPPSTGVKPPFPSVIGRFGLPPNLPIH